MSDAFGSVLVAIADAAATAAASAHAASLEKAPFPATFDRTKRALARMLTEDCGASILDSGGAYGRHWQRNQAQPIWEQPETTLSAHVYNGRASLDVTHNVFHWLAQCLEYDRRLTKKLRKLGRDQDLYGLELAKAFPEYLAERGHDVDSDVWTVNTYNGEDLLSQVLQYVSFTCDGTRYVALQIHGGADVRGGYSEPAVFVASEDSHTIDDNARAGIVPDWEELRALQEERAKQGELFPAYGPDDDEERRINWTTDDGCHWYFDGSCGRDYDAKQLDKMEAIEIASRDQWVKGKVCVLPDGTALCPFTSCRLVAGYY